MAIRMMTSEARAHLPNVETVRDYRGHEEGRMDHGTKCPHSKERDLSGRFSPECVHEGLYSERCHGPGKPLYMETSHVGLVLALGEYNGYDDSDFYAVCWNWETMRTERVEYASTRGWTYPNGAAVDATPEVLAAYEAYCQKAQEQRRQAEQEREAKRVARGKRVRVARGRKVPQGTEGECIWVGAGHYGERVGIKDAAGTVHWTALSNVEVVVLG